MGKNEPYDPLKGVISTGSVPAGNYTGVFKTAEHLPVADPDPMTGKGGRQWAGIRWQWEVIDGEYKGKMVSAETTTKNGSGSRQYQVLSWLLGKPPSSAYDLTGCVGKRYLLTVAPKAGKTWVEVQNAMLIPNQ
jgi:hypothetical protein